MQEQAAVAYRCLRGTGVKEENYQRMSELCDGVIMGTSLKIDRNTFNPIDANRAKEFIKKANDIRNK